MLNIVIPGAPALELHHLVLDFNGTLACDGGLLDGVAERLQLLAGPLQLHVVTGDTFGSAGESLAGVPCDVVILSTTRQAEAKRHLLQRFGAGGVACIGNGRNDRLMMKAAALGIGVVQAEGAAPETLMAADVVVHTAHEALDLLLHPLRLTATLRD
jgi:soluble P-type ATPase